MDKPKQDSIRKGEHPTESEIDEALLKSLPASAPPGRTLGVEQPATSGNQPSAGGMNTSLETVIVTRPGDLVVGFMVGRVLPSAKRRMVGPRHIWWNFVSNSTERIELAKADWKAGRFAPVPDETRATLLPESGLVVVRYP